MSERAAVFFTNWQTEDIKHIRHKICEGLVGARRWEKVVEEKKQEGEGKNGVLWKIKAEKRKDIYPLIGGKHKKWIVIVERKDSNEEHEPRIFESPVGYNHEIDQIWVEVKEYIM